MCYPIVRNFSIRKSHMYYYDLISNHFISLFLLLLVLFACLSILLLFKEWVLLH